MNTRNFKLLPQTFDSFPYDHIQSIIYIIHAITLQSVYRRILCDGGADSDYIAGFEALCLKEIERQGMTMWADLNPQELYVELNLVGDIHKH